MLSGGGQCFSVLSTRNSDVILTKWATVVGEVTSPSSDTLYHSWAPVLYALSHPDRLVFDTLQLVTVCKQTVRTEESILMQLLYPNRSDKQVTSIALAWWLESLPSNPAARFRFPVGSGILIYNLALGVCPLYSVLCCLRRC